MRSSFVIRPLGIVIMVILIFVLMLQLFVILNVLFAFILFVLEILIPQVVVNFGLRGGRDLRAPISPLSTTTHGVHTSLTGYTQMVPSPDTHIALCWDSQFPA